MISITVMKGRSHPGTPEGVDYNGFGRPAINGAGRIAFRGIMTGAGVGSQNNQALWHGTPGALTLLARTADVAPGATPSGAMFSAFSDPVINEAGRVVFKATLTGVGVGSDNNDGIWAADSAGNVSKVLQEGDSIDVVLTQSAHGPAIRPWCGASSKHRCRSRGQLGGALAGRSRRGRTFAGPNA